MRRDQLPEDRTMTFLAYLSLVLGIMALVVGVMTALNWHK